MATTQSKAAVIRRLLSRGKGATLVEIGKATGWQPHSCRAFLTGVRKTHTVTREQRNDGALAYRLTCTPQNPSEEGIEPIEGAVDPRTDVEETAGAEAEPQ